MTVSPGFCQPTHRKSSEKAEMADPSITQVACDEALSCGKPQTKSAGHTAPSSPGSYTGWRDKETHRQACGLAAKYLGCCVIRAWVPLCRLRFHEYSSKWGGKRKKSGRVLTSPVSRSCCWRGACIGTLGVSAGVRLALDEGGSALSVLLSGLRAAALCCLAPLLCCF